MARLPKANGLLHGGDYNPDQWQAYPKILAEDSRLMGLARVNTASLNIFGWSALEPEEGRFEFGWLDRAMDAMAKLGGHAILATPGAAKPAWLAAKHPDICRAGMDGQREPYKGRHNHCASSPIYKEKAGLMARRLAERYKGHPALIAWHVNNEFNGGPCYCGRCFAAFQAWLEKKYKTLDALNHAWWNAFWSHTLSDWTQADPRDPENLGMELDWKRFQTDLCIEFFRAETAALKELTPEIPLTTNYMGPGFNLLDYWKLAEELDFASWDGYPSWHQGDDVLEASNTAFAHDFARSLKRAPFLLMESTPENTNWMEVGMGKRPGMHAASSLQAVARGSDSVMYFQWRKGRGGFEQFHGAVVDHEGTEKTRVFKEVASLGIQLEKLAGVRGSGVDAEVALVWDYEARWALELSKGPRNSKKNYEQDAKEHFHGFWRRGIPVDFVSLKHDFGKYRLLIAPHLYMASRDFAARVAAFVKAGGTFVTTYLAGTVDEQALAWLGGRPGGELRKVLGIWAEEMSVLGENSGQKVKMGSKSYAARDYADIVHLEGAKALAAYASDWYAKSPALTENAYGKGRAFYIASRNSGEFLDAFYGGLAKRLKLKAALEKAPPWGVEASWRGRHLFLINYTQQPKLVALGKVKGTDLLSGRKAARSLKLGAYGVAVLEKEKP